MSSGEIRMLDRAPRRNWLIDQVEPQVRRSFAEAIRGVELPKGRVLLHPGDEVESVYFPEGSLIGLSSSTPAGEAVQTALIGWDGALGVFEACGTRTSRCQAEVLVEGTALAMAADDYRRMFDASEALRAGVHKHVELLLAESRQDVACNALHAVEARLSRWVLEALERSRDGRVLPVTQEALSQMLGVQRTTITAAMSGLQARGVLRTARGAVQVLDRAALEKDACCCRETVLAARQEIYTSDDEAVCDR